MTCAVYKVLRAAEEECLVLPDGTADRSTKLIAVQLRLWRHAHGRKVIARRIRAVAVELIHLAMKLVGAGLGDDRNGRPTFKLRFREAAFHLDLGDRLRGRQRGEIGVIR